MQLHDALAILTDPHSVTTLIHNNWTQGLAVVAAIVFLETGLVVLPFLPGGSLLFAVGLALGVSDQPTAPAWMAIVTAAIVGDALNYSGGRTGAGPWIVGRGWIRNSHLERTRSYFGRYGGSAVTVAQFIPIVRTIAPFIAGLSGMPARKFFWFNCLGGCIWVTLMLGIGLVAGRFPWVHHHFTWVTIAIITISLLPLLFQWRAFRRSLGSRNEQ